MKCWGDPPPRTVAIDIARRLETFKMQLLLTSYASRLQQQVQLLLLLPPCTAPEWRPGAHPPTSAMAASFRPIISADNVSRPARTASQPALVSFIDQQQSRARDSPSQFATLSTRVQSGRYIKVYVCRNPPTGHGRPRSGTVQTNGQYCPVSVMGA